MAGTARPVLLVACVVTMTLVIVKRSAVVAPTSEVSTEVFSTSATVTVMPEYPGPSLAHGIAGVAVALATSDAAGRVASVAMLEAPDEPIAVSVQTALSKWVFALGGKRGRVIFYFVLENGKGRVVMPMQSLPRAVSFPKSLGGL